MSRMGRCALHIHASAFKPATTCDEPSGDPQAEGLTISSSMRLLRLSEVEKSSADPVSRYSPARMALLFPGVVCLGTTLLLIHWEGRVESLHYIAYYIFAVLLLGLALLRKFLFARFRPSIGW